MAAANNNNWENLANNVEEKDISPLENLYLTRYPDGDAITATIESIQLPSVPEENKIMQHPNAAENYKTINRPSWKNKITYAHTDLETFKTMTAYADPMVDFYDMVHAKGFKSYMNKPFINLPPDTHYITPLTYMILNRAHSTAYDIIRQGVDMTARNTNGTTAMYYMIKSIEYAIMYRQPQRIIRMYIDLFNTMVQRTIEQKGHMNDPIALGLMINTLGYYLYYCAHQVPVSTLRNVIIACGESGANPGIKPTPLFSLYANRDVPEATLTVCVPLLKKYGGKLDPSETSLLMLNYMDDPVRFNEFVSQGGTFADIPEVASMIHASIKEKNIPKFKQFLQHGGDTFMFGNKLPLLFLCMPSVADHSMTIIDALLDAVIAKQNRHLLTRTCVYLFSDSSCLGHDMNLHKEITSSQDHCINLRDARQKNVITQAVYDTVYARCMAALPTVESNVIGNEGPAFYLHHHDLDKGVITETMDTYFESAYSGASDLEKLKGVKCIVPNCNLLLLSSEISATISADGQKRWEALKPKDMSPIVLRGLDQRIDVYESILYDTKVEDPARFGMIYEQTMCPFCLEPVTRSEGCVYMSHSSSDQRGNGASPYCNLLLRSDTMYEKYKAIVGGGTIRFCVECGSPCRDHGHLSLTDPTQTISAPNYGTCPLGRRVLLARVLAVRDTYAANANTPRTIKEERDRCAVAANAAASNRAYLARADEMMKRINAYHSVAASSSSGGDEKSIEWDREVPKTVKYDDPEYTRYYARLKAEQNAKNKKQVSGVSLKRKLNRPNNRNNIGNMNQPNNNVQGGRRRYIRTRRRRPIGRSSHRNKQRTRR